MIHRFQRRPPFSLRHLSTSHIQLGVAREVPISPIHTSLCRSPSIPRLPRLRLCWLRQRATSSEDNKAHCPHFDIQRMTLEIHLFRPCHSHCWWGPIRRIPSLCRPTMLVLPRPCLCRITPQATSEDILVQQRNRQVSKIRF